MKTTSLLPKILALVAAGTFAAASYAEDDQAAPNPNVGAGTADGKASNTGSGTSVHSKIHETDPTVQTDDAGVYPNVATGTGRGSASHTGKGTGADSDGNPNVDDAQLADTSRTSAAKPISTADDDEADVSPTTTTSDEIKVKKVHGEDMDEE